MAESKGLKNYPSYEYNPFRIEAKFIGKVKEVDIETAAIGYKPVDTQSHVRVFSDMFDDFPQLNSMGLKLLAYIFKNLKGGVNGGEITLNIQVIMSSLELDSRASVYKGILNLLDTKLIARKVGSDEYFINPQKFFLKNRVKWFDAMKKVDAAHPDIPKIYPIKLVSNYEKRTDIQGEQLQSQDKDNAEKGQEG